MKKALSILLVIVMLCGTFAGLQITTTAKTDLSASGSCGENVTYTFDSSTGELLITGNGAMMDYSSSNSPFSQQIGIKTIIIDSGVTSIGDNAFRGCSGLKIVRIGNSVTAIGSYAFYDCQASICITIPSSVKYIGYYASYGCGIRKIVYRGTVEQWNKIYMGSNNIGFENGNPLYCPSNQQGSCGSKVTYSYTCTNNIGVLTISGTGKMDNYTYNSSPFLNLCVDYLIVKDGVTKIGDYAFYRSAAIKTVTLPNTITSIGQDAFCDCSDLTSFQLSNSVTDIGGYAFSNCDSLTSITIPNSISSIGEGWFSGCSSLTSINIPDTVTDIGRYAFSNCSSLISITIPASIKDIGYKAFLNCISLNRVDISSLESWCDISFYSYYYTSDSHFYSNPLFYAKNLYLNGELITDLVIPKTVKTIKYGTFAGASSILRVNIPDTVTAINSGAFFNCSGINELTLPVSAVIKKPSTSSIGTFNNCANIEKVILTKGTGVMQNFTASSSESNTPYYYTPWYISRSKLKEVVLDEGVTCIGDYAFYNCSGLTIIDIPDSVISIGNYAFYNCSGLTIIDIPDSVTSIGNYAFYNCSGLTIINIPNSVTSIGNSAFSDCNGLKSITIPNSVTSISSDAFSGCSRLTSITIPDSVATIGESAFLDCNCIKKVELGTGLTTIAPSAFLGCSSINSTHLYSKQLVSTQELISSLPTDSILYAFPSTDAQIYCEIYGINYIPFDEPRCEEGVHTYIETIITEPTCNNQGQKRYTCRFCNDIHNEVISSLGHNYTTEVIKPTCIAKGYTKHTCSRCGDTYTDNQTDMITHTVVTDAAVAPTCQQTGLTEGTHCSFCGTVLTEQQIVPITNHQYSEAEVPANCTQQGFTVFRCIYCADSFRANYSPATDNHDYKATVTTPATCSQRGVKTFTCSICGDKYTELIAMIEHTPVTDKPVASTCVKSGLTEGSHCAVCGYVITEQAVVPAKSHTYTSTITKDSSCSQAGVKTFTCSICGDKYTEAIPMKVHTVVSDSAVAPTCTKYGLSAGKYCSVCGKIFETQEKVEPLGHDFGSVVTPATLTENGLITHPCSRCDKAATSDVIYAPKTFTLAKTSYVYSGKAIAPTVTVKDAKGNVLKKGTDYTVAYKANKAIGTASAVITFKGNYKGTKTLAFTIVPKAANLALTGAKKAFTAKWTKIAGVTGYQIQYATNAKLTGAKTVNVKGAAKYVQAFKNLKGGAKYYVRIRAYKKVGGKNYFSAWSAAKAVTTKK